MIPRENAADMDRQLQDADDRAEFHEFLDSLEAPDDIEKLLAAEQLFHDLYDEYERFNMEVPW